MSDPFDFADEPFDDGPEPSPAPQYWERDFPTYDELDGWRVCDVCGTSWAAGLKGFDFFREWRHHVTQHRKDQLH